jgi:hypothetical protein
MGTGRFNTRGGQVDVLGQSDHSTPERNILYDWTDTGKKVL